MARIEWVAHRLHLWSIWKVRDESSGLGYPKQSAFTRESFQGGFRESYYQVFGHDEAITDQAIQSLKADRPAHHETLLLYYVGTKRRPVMGVKELSKYFDIRPESIHARLGECDRAIARWLEERAENAKRVSATFLHTSAP